MNLSDSIVRLIRTYVPIFVGTLLTAAGRWAGVELDTTAAVSVAVPLVTGAYYTAAKWAERRWPRLGWLLGHPIS